MSKVCDAVYFPSMSQVVYMRSAIECPCCSPLLPSTSTPNTEHDGFLTVKLEDTCPRPTETFMRPLDPLLYLMYPNSPLRPL